MLRAFQHYDALTCPLFHLSSAGAVLTCSVAEIAACWQQCHGIQVVKAELWGNTGS